MGHPQPRPEGQPSAAATLGAPTLATDGRLRVVPNRHRTPAPMFDKRRVPSVVPSPTAPRRTRGPQPTRTETSGLPPLSDHGHHRPRTSPTSARPLYVVATVAVAGGLATSGLAAVSHA